MSDTIELLEAIGSDASLRYATVNELKSVLERARASAELTEALTVGNGALLRKRLKPQQAHVVQSNATAFLDEE